MEPESAPETDRSVALRRLRWAARRGLLENDLLIGRFLDRHGQSLEPAEIRGLRQLLMLSDNDLLDLLLSRKELSGSLDTIEIRAVLARLRDA